MSGKIFISYRRADSQWAAARLYDALSARFPDHHLFMDVEEIAPGQDFTRVLADQVGACDVFLALIGPDWLNQMNGRGVRRIDDPDDFVRIEIASALSRENTLTVPVMLDGAEPLTEADLPDLIKPLARRQIASLAHETFRRDVEALIPVIAAALPSEMATKPGGAAPSLRRLAAPAAFVMGALAIGALAYSWLTAPPDPSGAPNLTSFQECDVCPEMIAAPSGDFLMGPAPDDPHAPEGAGPQRAVTVMRFALAVTELSRASYNRCVADSACSPLHRNGPPSPDDAATHVRWLDAQDYVRWLNDHVPGAPYRLPSEAEWEYAAKAGTETAYPWGDAPDRAYGNLGREICCIGHAEGPDKWKDVAPIGQFMPNPWGFHDMAGNLAEWTEDMFTRDMSNAPNDGSAFVWEASGGWPVRRVLKGGAFNDRPWQVRPAARSSNEETWVLGSYGVRIARDMDPVSED